MGRRAYAGGAAATTLSSGINSAATSISVADASTWPSSGAFSIVIDRGLVGEEKILVGSRSGNTLTVTTRGYDGTSAAAHTSGATVEHVGTAIDFDEANDHVNSTGTVHSTSTVAPSALIIPTATSPAQTVDGSAVWDSDDNLLTVGDGASRKTMVDTTSTQSLTNKTLDAASTLGGVSGTSLAADRDAWTAYTPTLLSSSGTPAQGNGSFTGAYKLIGKTLFLRITLDCGTTTTYGTGTLRVSLPAGLTIAGGPLELQPGRFALSGSTKAWNGTANAIGGLTYLTLMTSTSSSQSELANVTATVPETLDGNCFFWISTVIEVA